MPFTAYRRVASAHACNFCVMLATRGAVYHSEVTAGDRGSGNQYHRHCHCHAELETDPANADEVVIDPEDANRIIKFRKDGKTYQYDLSEFRVRGVTDPPKPPLQPKVVEPPKPITHIDDLPQGSAESLEEAIGKTNPKFDTGEAEWRNNCTRCVVAAEMRARGYQVIARGRTTGDNSQGILNRVFSQFRLFHHPSTGKLSSIAKEVAEDQWTGAIDKTLEARVWIRWTWKGQHSGHIVMGEIRKGKLTIYDPQTGLTHTAKDFAGQVTDVRYVRVDDLPLSDQGALEYVVGE